MSVLLEAPAASCREPSDLDRWSYAIVSDFTIAFYGPNLSQATKVTVGIVPSENAEVEELRDWKVDYGDIRADPGIAREILEFIEKHRVLSVAMTDGVIGCPHQEGVDYEGEWCPVCEFWHGRDRFTGHRVH